MGWRWAIGGLALGAWLTMAAPQVAEAKRCPGTKQLYKGKCYYPDQVKQMKRGRKSSRSKKGAAKGRKISATERSLVWELLCWMPNTHYGYHAPRPLVRPDGKVTQAYQVGRHRSVYDEEFTNRVGRLGARTYGESAEVNTEAFPLESNRSKHNLRQRILWSRLSKLQVDLGPDMPFTQLNPAMIEWAFANLTPPPEHRMCGMTAQQFYLRFFRQMVLQYAGTYYFMDQRSAFTDFSVLKYVTWRERGDHRTAYNTICQQSPDEAQDICHWWFRREIDGTRPAIVEVLRKVIKRYDPEFAARAPAIMRSLK